MPRGAEYDNGVIQSDNAIETGPNKAHGTNPVRSSLVISPTFSRHMLTLR